MTSERSMHGLLPWPSRADRQEMIRVAAHEADQARAGADDAGALVCELTRIRIQNHFFLLFAGVRIRRDPDR